MRAFHRASLMMAAIAAVMAQTAGSPLLQQQRLAELGPYESRGKGGKRAYRASGISAARRAAMKARNRRRNKLAHRGKARRS